MRTLIILLVIFLISWHQRRTKINLIISNPPYVRHHYIANDVKKTLNESVKNIFGLSFSGLTGLYGYFMTLSALWLQNNGISVWLVPNEFLDVNYGKEIKTFLLKKMKLLRIHRFNPLNIQFSDALVTSAVVFYSTGQTSDTVLFTSGNDINKPDFQKIFLSKNLNSNDKWSNYFTVKSKVKKYLTTIGDYFYVKRGIATGSNKHFILTSEIIKKFNISNKYLIPILPSPRFIKTDIIETETNGCVNGIKKLYLLNISCSENEIANLPENIIEYLNEIYNDIKDNYIIRNRTPWFRQEYRPECPFLMSYMGRNSNKPFRLFLNKTNATASNVYLMLYPKFNWKAAEAQNRGFLKNIYDELLNIRSENFVSSGRVYGGGLYKLEPRELMNVSINNILSENSINNIQHFANRSCTRFDTFQQTPE